MNGIMQLMTTMPILMHITMPIYMHTARRKTHFQIVLGKQFWPNKFFYKET